MQGRLGRSSSGGALSDAIMRRIRRDPKWGAQYLARRGIDPATTARLLKDEDEPKFLDKLLQPLDAFGSARRSAEMNAGHLAGRVLRGEADWQEAGSALAASLSGVSGLLRETTGFDLNTWGMSDERVAKEKARLAEESAYLKERGYFDANEEAAKSLTGRQGASFTHAVKDFSDEQWLPEPVRDWLGKETTQFWLGMALDVGEGVALDPSFGLSGGTKASRAVKAADTVGDVGVTAAKLADIGIEVGGDAGFVARYSDDFTKTAARIGGEGDEAVDLAARLEKGVNLKELPPAAKQEIWDASTRWAQNAQAGTKRVVHAPFLRKAVDEAGDASYGLGALVPTLDDVAKRGAGEAGTIFERFGKTPGLKAVGHQGARVPLLELGTRGVDKGGVKMFGQTLLDVQPQMEKASGAIWKTLNQNRIYNAAKGLVNNYARIDIEGDRLLSAWARMAGGGLDAANSIATHAGAEMYRAVGEVVGDDATADAVGATIPKAFPHWEETTKLNDEKMRLVRQTEQLIADHKLFDDEHLEAARATVGKDAAKASTKLDTLAIKEAEIAEELAASFEVLGLEPASADSLRAAAAELRGRQEGYAVAFERSNAAYRQAQSDIDKFVNRSATLREQAAKKPTVLDTIAGKTPETEGAALETISQRTLGSGNERFAMRYGEVTLDVEVSPTEKTAWIADISVPEGARRQGLGSSAFRAVQDEVQGRYGVERWEVSAYDDAADFWKAQGFSSKAGAQRDSVRGLTDLELEVTPKPQLEAVIPEAARTAVGDSWESVRRARGAQAQMDDDALRVGIFDEKRNRLLEARKKASAAQTRTNNIRVKQAVQADRLQAGTTKANRLEKTISTIEAKRARINEIDTEITKLLDDVDYDLMEQELIRIGYAPERARELREYAENDLKPFFHEALEAKKAVGMGEYELPGYVPQMPPQPMGILETARVKAAGTQAGQAFTAKTGVELEPASYRAQAKAIEDVYGVKWADLEPPEGGRIGAGSSTRSIRPRQPKSRVFKGMEGTAEHPGRVVTHYVDESGQIVDVPGLQTSTDIRTAAAMKADDSLRTVAAAKFEDELVSSQGRPLNFDVETMARRTGESVEDIEARIIPEGYVKRPVTRDGKTVDYILDETVAKWADTYKKVFITDEDANLFLRGYDRLLGSLKGMMTAWGPAFHLRNLPSNYLMGYSQGYGDVASWTDGYRGYAAVKAGIGDEVMINVGDEVKSAKAIYDDLGGWVIRGEVGQGDIGLQGVRTAKMETPRRNIFSEAMRELNPQHVGGEVGAFTEDAARFSVYLSARRQGVAHEAALLIPDRVLYNYLPSAMTGTEREAIKRVIPFWAWIKQNVPAQLMNMAKRPGRANLLTRIRNAGFSATGIDPADLPDWMRESYAVPLPNNRDDGTHTIWNPTQFPIQDLKRLGGSVKDPQGMKELVGMTSPLIKSPIEYGLNYDTFRGRQSEPDYDDQAERVPGYLRLFDQAVDLLGGSAAWESVKAHWNWVDILDDETGETYLAMPARERKLLKDFLPFMENTVGRLAGEGDPVKDTRNRTAIFTGMKLDPVTDAELEEAKRRRLKALIEDELQRLRDEGKL